MDDWKDYLVITVCSLFGLAGIVLVAVYYAMILCIPYALIYVLYLAVV
jgi:hypothetical protein